MVWILPAPFHEDFGERLEVEIKGAILLRESILRWPRNLLERAFPSYPPVDENILARFLFIQDGRLVRLDETVTNQSTIQVMLTATGG
jgi:hypothetical protein